MAVLIHFFCKMYFLYPSQSCKKNLAAFFGVLPPKKGPKFQAQVPNEVVFQNWGAPAPQFRKGAPQFCKGAPQFQKNLQTLWKIAFSRPQKVIFRSIKKVFPPNPYGHGLFAKKRIKIGKFWPWQSHFWSTSAYRGSPPCAIFLYPDNKEI